MRVGFFTTSIFATKKSRLYCLPTYLPIFLPTHSSSLTNDNDAIGYSDLDGCQKLSGTSKYLERGLDSEKKKHKNLFSTRQISSSSRSGGRRVIPGRSKFNSSPPPRLSQTSLCSLYGETKFMQFFTVQCDFSISVFFTS